MAENAVLIDVIPNDPEADIDKVLEDIRGRLSEEFTLKDYKVEPYVFGLKKIRLMLIVPEREGILEEIEEIFSNIPDVESEIVTVTRI